MNHEIILSPGLKRNIGISVFLTAFAFGLNITGISPVLAVLNEKYQSYGTSRVQLLQTVPYLCVIIGSLAVGRLTEILSKKKIILAGLCLIGICGVAPFFFDSFYLLFAVRVLIGFGFGTVGPLNTAVVTDFFPPEQRAGYMGLHVVGMGVGAMTGNLLGGILAAFGSGYFFLVYMIAFISMIGVKIILPEVLAAKTAGKSGDMRLNSMVYVISLASFVHTLFINAYSTNIGIYISENISADPGLTGAVTAVNSAFALLVGLLFSKLSGFLKNYTLPFSVFSAALGYGILLVFPDMPGILAASALCGISLSAFSAIGAYLISISVKKEAVAKASGFFSVVGSIGGLIAPVFMGKFSDIILGANTAHNQFMTAFAGMLLFTVITLILVKRKKN